MNCANKCEKLSTFILIAQWFGDIIRGKRFYSSVHYGILHMRGDGMSDFDKSEYWFESAEYDLQTARAMLET